ncbi:TonB family protein [Paraburkholderia humisilvae]|uniref:TonB C-terminal domain-containing protein n=1 Tax=Paraburkholderia humisilvae TaxID=627669 RepID=A0A6J5E6P0_9BURK|nr:TonB family protein [Paraburkholderia humisilvae]CAB3762130.1 hypothetical protein LMG29542_04248 [Paraburkholderia humisilvae]
MSTTLQQPQAAKPPRTVVVEALVVSFVIEVLMLTAVAGWFTHHTTQPQPKPPEPIKVTLAAPSPAPAPVPPAAPAQMAPPKPPVPVKPQPVHPLKQPTVTKRNPNPVQPTPDLPKAPAASTAPTEPAQTEHAHDTPAPPVDAAQPQAQQPQATRSDAKPSAIFQARLRDAVQAAVRYPSAARIMRLSGHVRLGFMYQDGAISNPHVVQSAGQKMLDDAALAALNDASFPVPPPELKGHLLNLEIVVTFAPSS